MSGLADRPVKPQACVIDGDKVGIFIGSGYRQLTLEQARVLQAQLDAAIAEVSRG